jgi:hypothetical protein
MDAYKGTLKFLPDGTFKVKNRFKRGSSETAEGVYVVDSTKLSGGKRRIVMGIRKLNGKPTDNTIYFSVQDGFLTDGWTVLYVRRGDEARAARRAKNRPPGIQSPW